MLGVEWEIELPRRVKQFMAHSPQVVLAGIAIIVAVVCCLMILAFL